MNKERLIELLNLLAMGRRDSVEELADMLSGETPDKTPVPVVKPKGR